MDVIHSLKCGEGFLLQANRYLFLCDIKWLDNHSLENHLHKDSARDIYSCTPMFFYDNTDFFFTSTLRLIWRKTNIFTAINKGPISAGGEDSWRLYSKAARLSSECFHRPPKRCASFVCYLALPLKPRRGCISLRLGLGIKGVTLRRLRHCHVEIPPQACPSPRMHCMIMR